MLLLISDDLLIDGSSTASLRSHSVWGVLRGLESFTQLVYKRKESGYSVSIKNNVATQMILS